VYAYILQKEKFHYKSNRQSQVYDGYFERFCANLMHSKNECL